MSYAVEVKTTEKTWTVVTKCVSSVGDIFPTTTKLVFKKCELDRIKLLATLDGTKTSVQLGLPYSVVDGWMRRRLVKFTGTIPAYQKWCNNAAQVMAAVMGTPIKLSMRGEAVVKALLETVQAEQK